MSTVLSNIIKSHASSLDHSAGQVKFGTVTSVNAANGTARVTIQPEAVLSGWLPILSQWVGNGWGMVALPAPGDQVLLVPQEGDGEQGIIVGKVFSVKQVPPAAPVGEFWLVHQSGSFLKLCNDGTIRINGDLHVAGDVFDRLGAVSSLRTHYNSHTHKTGNNQITSLPDPLD
jgi:phage baseplate assembly protein V